NIIERAFIRRYLVQQELMKVIRKKYKCLLILLVILFMSYFSVPLIITLSSVDMLRNLTFLGILFIWIYTFLQFPFTWFLGLIYFNYTKKLDEKVEELLRKGES